MAIDFPASPTNGQTFTSGALVYTYDGTKWTAQPAGVTGGTKIEVGNTKAEIVDTGSDGRFVVTTEGSERARVDSSGRLLVGTSSSTTGASSQYAPLQVIGNGSSATDRGAIVNLGHSAGAASITTGELIGQILFTDNAAGEFGFISCLADVNAGSGDYPGRLVFSVTADGAASPTEALRIIHSGRHEIGSAQQGIFCGVTSAAGTATAVFVAKHSITRGSVPVTGTDALVIWSNGNVVNVNNSYGSISDIKLKENIVDANSQWNDLKALQVRNYNLKEGQTHTQIGLVAQEAELVSPGLVTESPDLDAEGNDLGTVTKSVNYSVLYMKAVKALQEAMERIETLEAKVAALEAQ
jgi:hypothetical protein